MLRLNPSSALTLACSAAITGLLWASWTALCSGGAGNAHPPAHILGAIRRGATLPLELRALIPSLRAGCERPIRWRCLQTTT
jgi:hypothetical protein